MPTPKFTPGAQLVPLSFSNPSFLGLNTEMGGGILPPEWATKLENVVFDEIGRPAARSGWLSITSTPVSGTIKRIFEYYTADGVGAVISTTDSDIFTGTSAPSSIKGTLTITDGNIMFDNFNDKLIAFGIGTSGLPAVRTTANFADITVNSQCPDSVNPSGSIGTAAFGRLWIARDDGVTIQYCALLDETRWATADGGGIIDMSKVWPAGQDSIVAIQEFGGDLIVFGSQSTVILTDGAGSDIGINPLNLYVSDTIPGVGAVSQFALTRAVGDLWVLTPFGVVGLQREIVHKSTPYTNLSKNVQSGITGAADGEADKDNITLEYNPHKSMVVANFPSSQQSFYFDTRQQLQDGAYRAAQWVSPLQTMKYIRSEEALYGSLSTTDGEIMNYTGFSDDGESFFFDYESGWLNLGEELNVYLKFVKRMTSFTYVTQNVQVTHKVKYDFADDVYSLAKAATGTVVAEYNDAAADGGPAPGSTIAEYNLSAADGGPEAGSTIVEYGGGVVLRTLDAPLGGGGQYIKVGLRLDTSEGNFTLQQLNLYAKIGRLAT
jgi:hypothetical protein